MWWSWRWGRLGPLNSRSAADTSLAPSNPQPYTLPPARLTEGDYVVELAVGAFGQSPKSENTIIFLSTTVTVRRGLGPGVEGLLSGFGFSRDFPPRPL